MYSYELNDDPKLTRDVHLALRMLASYHPTCREAHELGQVIARVIANFSSEARSVFLEKAPNSLKAMVNDQVREIAKISSN